MLAASQPTHSLCRKQIAPLLLVQTGERPRRKLVQVAISDYPARQEFRGSENSATRLSEQKGFQGQHGLLLEF